MARSFVRILEKCGPAVAIALFAVVTHWALLKGGVLFTSDGGAGINGLLDAVLPEAFAGYWYPLRLLGKGVVLVPGWSNFALCSLPVNFFCRWIYAIDLFVASVAFYAYLRRVGFCMSAGLLGVLTAFWLGSNFSLIAAGHINKYGVLMFAALCLNCIELAMDKKQIGYWMLAGACMGGMFVEQQDVALFMCFLLGPYALFRVLCERDKSWWMDLLVQLVPMLVVALLIASPALLGGYKDSVGALGADKVEGSSDEAWNFATQWSWPPEESIAFVAPGYTGWSSSDPEGPYWGRMGRSAGWEQTRKGYRNFKLENTYIGVIPVLLAFVGLFMGGIDRKKERFFWGGMTLLMLALAFGKYFPLYKLFYQLPVVHWIRNPNKFLQVFQLALAVLTAYGADALLHRDEKGGE